MFSQIMLVQQFPLHGRNLRLKHQGMEVHESNLIQYHGIVDGIHRIPAPCKWTMTMNENGRKGVRVFSLESLLDHKSCFLFVVAFDLRLCHFSSARDLTIEIISMGCTKRHNTATCLRKARCPTAVGVYDAADVGKRFIEFDMRRGVR